MMNNYFRQVVCYSLLLAASTPILLVDCFSAVAPDLNNVIAYPNPYRPAQSAARAVTFDNLTAGAVRLRIFKVTGELVYERQAESSAGKVQWNVVDNDNNPAASGLYLYVVTGGSGQKATGKIAVIK